MKLEIDWDEAYLVALKARIRAAGYHYLGNYDGKLLYGPIYVLDKVIKDVMSSAVEVESENFPQFRGIRTIHQNPRRIRTYTAPSQTQN